MDSGYENYPLLDHVLFSNRLMIEDRNIVDLIIFGIVIFLSLIGNILVVVISGFCMRQRSLASIFLINLALSDLLFTVRLPFWVGEFIRGFTLGDTECKVLGFIFSAGYYSGIMFLLLMSAQCYMSIVHPLSSWRKGRWVTHVLICAWIVSFLASLPVVHSVTHSPSGFCTYNSKIAFLAVTYKENIVFVCAFLFMGFCYIRILQTIFKSPTNKRHRTTGLTFLLAATCFICWAPCNIVNFLWTLNVYPIKISTQVLEHLDCANYTCHLLNFTRCCVNPVIHGLFGLIFRKTAQKNVQMQDTVDSEQMGIGDLILADGSI